MAEGFQKLQQKVPNPVCGGKNNYTGVVVGYKTANTEDLAQTETADYVKGKAKDLFDPENRKNCSGCDLDDRDGTESPDVATNKPDYIFHTQVSDTTWIAFYSSMYRAAVNCKGNRPNNRPSARVGGAIEAVIYSSGNPACGEADASNEVVFAGCALARQISSNQATAKRLAREQALKRAKEDRAKILDTKDCPEPCRKDGTAILQPITLRAENVTNSEARLFQSKQTRWVAYARAFWVVKIRCLEPS